jgi:hypothetical protein
MWWRDDVTEELAIMGAVMLAIAAMIYLGAESKDVVLSVAGGLIGYMSGRTKA